MGKELLIKFKENFLPQTKVKELPEFVWNNMVRNFALAAFLFFSGIYLAISFKNWVIVATLFIMILVFSITYYFGWYLPFANNKVLWYDIEIINCMADTNNKKEKARAIFNRYIRKMYTVTLLNSDEPLTFKVVLKDTFNPKKGEHFRIYTKKDAIITNLYGEYLVNNVLYVEEI